MNNPQQFNIINPKRGSSDALYERVDSVPMWRRPLRYRPRFKDLRAFNPLRDGVRRVPGCVRRIWSPSPSSVRGKHAVPSSEARQVSKASPTSIKAARASGTKSHPLASNPVPRVQPISQKPLDSVLPRVLTKESKLDAAHGEPGSERVYDINDKPYQSSTPLYPNHKIGMALTTTQTILNYPNGHRDNHNDKVQRKSDKESRESVKSNGTSCWGILQIDEGAIGIKPKNSNLIDLVDISTLVPEYPHRPKRKPVAQKRAADEIQHHPLPHSASTHNLIQVLEVEASRQEQEKEVEATKYSDLYSQKSRTPRNSRRCGQVWDREETGTSFLAIKLLTDSL
ncbi:hypothetical protein EAF04_003363 [Stromatinia cepivora]|nr:hypothetical protein EAF04_003363 [Stromatinia cepivora]